MHRRNFVNQISVRVQLRGITSFLLAGVSLIVTLGVTDCIEETPSDYQQARKAMVTDQIQARGISDPKVLEAMGSVPRHRFVPPSIRHLAYADRPLPIGHEQTISQPYIVALMTESLSLRGDETVLEIGTGSGYQAAILAELVDSVFTIEIIEDLARGAREVLSELGYENVFVRVGDGYVGLPEHAPFEAIVVTCAPDHIPKPLIDQLAEGGRMVIPVGKRFQTLKLITKTEGQLEEEDIIPVLFVPMKGEHIEEK